jgi:ADP-heptose:LPS heptosyltransferase
LKFDFTVDPQSLSKSAILAWLSGAKQRIGFQTPRGRELSLWLNNHFIKQSASHLVDCQLELLQPLGIDSPQVQFRLPINPQAEEKANDFLQTAHLSGGYVVMNPGAGWDSRLWPADRFGRVARSVGQRHQVPTLVVWSGDRERAWAEQILTHSGGHAVLAPATSLPELAVFLQQARLFLGSDTGPLHLAHAVGTTCIGLHGTTRYQASGAYGDQHISIQDRYQAGTSRARRRASNDAMRAIEVERVVQACDEVLARPTDRAVQDAA